jgi:hypothetical protein
MDLIDFKNKISECKAVESGIWTFIHEDTKHYNNLLREHAKLESYISELYREITLIGKEHELFEHITTDTGKKITELLRGLRGKLVNQYEDLLKIKDIIHNSNKTTFSDQDVSNIKVILDGEKNGQNESETSQKIKQIEREIISSILSAPRKIVLSNLIIENPKNNQWEHYQDSLVRLRQKGFNRHLRPLEFFEILLEHFRTGGLGTREDVAKNIMCEDFEEGEWLSLAFRRTGNMLEIALDPENIVWDGKKYVTIGDLRVDRTFVIGHSNSFYAPVREFKQDLINYLFGAEISELSKYHARIFFPPEGEWWPIGCGIDNVGRGSGFCLYGGNEKLKSRGCKPA